MSIWKTKWGWRAKFQHKGQDILGPGYFRYKAQAKAWVEDEKRRLKGRAATFDLPGLSDSYLDQVQQEQSYKTYSEKRASLSRLWAAVGSVDPRDVTPAQVNELLMDRARNASNNAANKDRKNIKAFYSWLQAVHGIMHDPTGPIKKKPHETQKRRLVPLEDIYKVIMAAGKDRPMIATYWHTGARKGEVLRLRWDDVNFEQGWIRLGTRKVKGGGMRYDRIPMNADLKSLLEGLWQSRDKTSDYLFPDYYQPDELGNNWKGEQMAHRLLVGLDKVDKETGEKYRAGGLCELAGVKRFGFHDIRHTVATYLNDVCKVGLKRVQGVLRHQRQTTTEIYTQGSYGDLKGEVEALEWEKVLKVAPKSAPNDKKEGQA
jgi:integrase